MAVCKPIRGTVTATSRKRVPKRKERSPPGAFRAASARLDLLNSMASSYRVPAFVDLSSDEDVVEESDMLANREPSIPESGGRSSTNRSSEQDEAVLFHYRNLPKSNMDSRSMLCRRRIITDRDDEGTGLLHSRLHKSHVLSAESVVASYTLPSIEDHQEVTDMARQNVFPGSRKLHACPRGNDETEERQSERRMNKRNETLQNEIEDLQIDMEGWDSLPKKPSKRCRRSTDTPSPHPHQDLSPVTRRHTQSILITGPPTAKKTRLNPSSDPQQDQRQSYDNEDDEVVFVDAHPRYRNTRTDEFLLVKRRPASQFLEAPYRPSLLHKSTLKYNKFLDPAYDALRDPESDIHKGCDKPLPSVEEVYARAERVHKRKTI